MIKGYSDFINENSEGDNIEDLYKMLISYIVNELNKGIEFNLKYFMELDIIKSSATINKFNL